MKKSEVNEIKQEERNLNYQIEVMRKISGKAVDATVNNMKTWKTARSHEVLVDMV